MASVVLRVENRGLDECLTCFASVSEAAANAGIDLTELEYADGAIRFQKSPLVSMEMRIEGNVVVGDVRPTASMILFSAWLMNALPRRASVIWSDGWPLFRCPPSDDRDAEDDPTPLVPNELEAA